MQSKPKTEFDCPFCHVKIALAYVAKNTKLVQWKTKAMLICVGCAKEYEAMVAAAMKKRIDDNYQAYEDPFGRHDGLSADTIIALRKEQEAIRVEDERLVDEEVDVMDAAKARKLFKKKGDQHEEAKPPLQVIREKFIQGLRKERQKRIIVPGGI